MIRRVYFDSTDDFIMWRAIDAIGPISTPRVLVVDDYPVGADALQLLLEQNGFEARTVNDASLACAVAEEWLPFAVIVDIVMPGVTGLETDMTPGVNWDRLSVFKCMSCPNFLRAT